MTRNQKKIEMALRSIGYEAESILWERIGPVMEMAGHTGGWMVDDYPIGLNLQEALEFIQLRPTCFYERKPRAAFVIREYVVPNEGSHTLLSPAQFSNETITCVSG